MKKIITLIALSFIGIIAKAQDFKIASNKILSIEKLAEIKGDTLFIYKNLDKALEVLNKSKSHKPFKYIIIIQKQNNGTNGNIYYPNWNIVPTFTEGVTTNLWITKPTLPNNQ